MVSIPLKYRYLLPFFISLLLFSTTTVSAEEEEDLDEMSELLDILEQETAVATKTKINADYVPGIVTVLQGSDLEAMGARTVWEALAFVPGVKTTINDLGRPLVAVRGISGSRHTGHLKLMVDSVGANPSFRGTNDALMMIPIEQVERIEMIRGSGASLYGEFSYSGVINIITRQDDIGLFASTAKYDNYGMGGRYSYSNPEQELKLNINAAGWQTNGADVDSGPDRFGNSEPNVSLSPNPTNEDEQLKSLIINLNHKQTEFSFFHIERDHGAYFGNGVLTPESDGTPKENEYWHLDLRHQLEFNSNLAGLIKFTFSEDEKEDFDMLLPPGAKIGPPAPPPGTPPSNTPPHPPTLFPDGDLKITYIKERRIEGGLDLTWTGWDRHEWLLGLSAAKVKVTDAWEASNLDISSLPPTPLDSIQLRPENKDVWINPGKKRQILSAVLQDQVTISDDLTLTMAVRYDNFDDVGDKVTPRIAAVWKLGEPHLLKFQYAEAYRPPTLAELYLPETGPGAHGNLKLDPETSKTFEAGYIYRQPNFVGRATLFYSKMEGVIAVQRVPGEIQHQPLNGEELKLKGIELEIEKRFGKNWKATANLSYLDAKDITNQSDIENSSELIGNIVLEGQLSNNLLAVMNYRHISNRKRSKADPRDDLKGYDTLDLTLSYLNFGNQGLTLRAGVKNIFDAEVKAPSGDYQNDLPRAGRTWWAQISKKF